MTTPVNGLTELVQAQTQPHVPINEALRFFDATVQISVASIANSPTGSEPAGTRYIVGTGSGAFAGHDTELALRNESGWVFYAPGDGWLARVQDEGIFYFFNATASPPAWEELTAGGAGLTSYERPILVVRAVSDAAPGGSTVGDLVVVGNAPSGDFSTFNAGELRQYNGTGWDLVRYVRQGELIVTTINSDNHMYYCVDNTTPPGWSTTHDLRNPALYGSMFPYWFFHRRLSLFFSGTPASSQVLYRMKSTELFLLLADFGYFNVTLTANPTADFDIDVSKNGVSIGTITIATDGSATGVTVGGLDYLIDYDDDLVFTAPASVDATIEDIGISFEIQKQSSDW